MSELIELISLINSSSMYSIIVYTNQISNVIIPQHHLKHPSAILHHHCLNLNGISSKKDYPDRNENGSNKQFETKYNNDK